MGLYKSVKNYLFVRSAFRTIREDSRMKAIYDPDVTLLGVFYFFVDVPNTFDDDKKNRFIATKMEFLNEVFVMANLDGIIRMSIRTIAEDENDVRYLVKIIPNVKLFSVFNFIQAAIYMIAIYYALKYGEVLIQKINI